MSLVRGLRVLVSLLVGLSGCVAAFDSPTQSEAGEWEAPFHLPETAIHMILLPGGRVLMFGARSAHLGTEAWVWDPKSNAITDASLHRRMELYCSGHSLLPDGRVFVAGGDIYGPHSTIGIKETMIFDPETYRWSRGPDMAFKRWYPSTLALPDGRTMIFSGLQDPEHLVRQVEVFDPVTGSISTLPDRASERLVTYPSLHVLPDGRIIKTISENETRFFDPQTQRWSPGPRMNTVWRATGNSVLLPGLDRVLVIGGGDASLALRDVEILDLEGDDPQWEFAAPMSTERVHASSVVLADGTVLVVGGNQEDDYQKPVEEAELYDPSTDEWTTMASQRAQRGYHSTAVLLPDGSVLSAGSDHGPMQRTAEIFRPPYLLKGPRPEIVDAPDSIAYGHAFPLRVDGDVDRLALIRPGSSTHAVMFDQRYVDLQIVTAGAEITASAPPTAAEAPPGWYMLFALSADGVPSEAAWVRVGV